MWNSASDAYLESRILSAGPIELVRMLYQTASGSIRDARRHLEAGDVLARSRAISKASQALLELTAALDFPRGGEIAQRLAQLYEYMLHRLTEANFRQTDAPLAEVLALLATLSEGWDAIQTPAPPSPPAEADERWRHAAFAADNQPAHAWSL